MQEYVRAYCKKPEKIIAIQNDGSIECFGAICSSKFGIVGNATRNADGTIDIETIIGAMRANVGDFVVRGSHGEFYPCKPDVFEAVYEEVK